MRAARVGLALAALLLAAALFWARAPQPGVRQVDPSASRLIGQPAPNVPVPSLDGGKALALLPGQPVLINFFASWCLPCHAEHAQLMALAQSGVRIYGVAVRDKPGDTRAFLQTLGNPYARTFSDVSGTGATAWDVASYPQSYMVDGKNIVRFKQAGDIRAEQRAQIIKTMQALEQGK